VAWLGEVPVNWELKRLGYFFEERREKVSDKDYPALSVTKNGIVPQIETAAKTDDGDNRKKVCAGDFVINSRSDRKGSSGISPLDGSVSLINTILRPREQVFPAYIHHLLRSVPFQEEFYRYGKGIVADLWSTNYSEMSGITLAMPTAEEQSAIATFLDRETAKIAALIAEQEKLLTLLAEKRQATISHAVTKGLNPDAPMKDSGVEWLGEVPAHWGFKRIKHVKSSAPNAFVDGPFGSNLKSEHFVDDGDIYVIESNFATQNKIDPSQLKTISFEHFQTVSRSEVLAGDIVIAKIGAQFGKASILPSLDKRSLVSGNSLKLSVNHAICSTEWVHVQLINLKNSGEIDLLSNGSAQPALSLGDMNNLPVLVPPLNEQIAITSWLKGETGRLDSLATEANRAIDLLKERRTALISAAVTGKIDVREAA
jgi:type I restriction enzyme S subunit